MARKRTVRPEATRSEASPKRPIQTFQYVRPSSLARTIVELCDGESLRGEVHVVPPGAGAEDRYDRAGEELWFVLRGRARAIGPGGILIGEFAAGDGLLIPRGTRCRFLSVGADHLELLLVGGSGRIGRSAAAETGAADDAAVERLSGRVL
jgi:mannose-6-phosphate isomerase-like protein (cupin superfamily)